jgi:hypothetical protein
VKTGGSVTQVRRSAVARPGFLNRDWRSGFADSNPLWLGTPAADQGIRSADLFQLTGDGHQISLIEIQTELQGVPESRIIAQLALRLDVAPAIAD